MTDRPISRPIMVVRGVIASAFALLWLCLGGVIIGGLALDSADTDLDRRFLAAGAAIEFSASFGQLMIALSVWRLLAAVRTTPTDRLQLARSHSANRIARRWIVVTPVAGIVAGLIASLVYADFELLLYAVSFSTCATLLHAVMMVAHRQQLAVADWNARDLPPEDQQSGLLGPPAA